MVNVDSLNDKIIIHLRNKLLGTNKLYEDLNFDVIKNLVLEVLPDLFLFDVDVTCFKHAYKKTSFDSTVSYNKENHTNTAYIAIDEYRITIKNHGSINVAISYSTETKLIGKIY